MDFIYNVIEQILKDIGTPYLVYPLAILVVIVLGQRLLMKMKEKNDTIWALRWADDICYANRQWAYSIIIVLGWVPILYLGDFLRLWLFSTTNRPFSYVVTILLTMCLSYLWIALFQRNTKEKYKSDCSAKSVTEKKYNLFDVYCVMAFIVGNIEDILGMYKGMTFLGLITEYRTIAMSLYALWAVYFVLGGGSVIYEKVRLFVLKIGFGRI